MVLLSSEIIVPGCGGSSSSDGNSDNTVTSRGIITGFGSVYVNDTRDRTNGTRFSIDDGSGVINAVEIERKTSDEIRIVAPVTMWDEINQTVVLAGVEVELSAATYENEMDQSISAAAFYAAPGVGEFIKIKDETADGVFEKAELDD